MKKNYLSYRDVSSLLNVPIGTIYSLVSQKRIPHVRFGRRFVRFEESEIVNWLQTKTVCVLNVQEVICE